MGRHKRLPELKRLEGNPGKRPIEDLLIVPDGTAFAPEHLDDDATACLELIRGQMPPNVYASVDSFALSAFATAWAIHKRASLALQGEELVVEGAKGGQVKNPLVDIINSQGRLMVSLGARLGLDPVARLGLKMPPERQRSKFDGLLGGRHEGARKFDA
jgi:P27 family predicted phage terminase small subunit